MCLPARVCALVTCGWLFGAFTRPGLSPCALWAAFCLARVRPCAEGSRTSQVCCFCGSHVQAAPYALCERLVPEVGRRHLLSVVVFLLPARFQIEVLGFNLKCSVSI